MLPIVLSPDTAYATKSNIAFPGSQTLATAAELRADATTDYALANAGVDAVTIAIAAGSIEIANP